MRNFLIIISVICIFFFIWSAIDYKRRKRENSKKKDKPSFRTDKDCEEYAKPMEDEHETSVDFEDAE